MRDCKQCRGLLVEALYGELSPKQEKLFKNHIGACPSCAAEFKALTQVLETMGKRVRPEPGQDFWDGYWDRLSQRMEEEKAIPETSRSGGKALSRSWNLAPRWSFQAAAALALIVAGILIGRAIFSPPRVPVEVARQGVPRPALPPEESDPLLRARSFVDRSKLVLLALVNYNPKSEDPYGLDLPLQKQISQELVGQAGDLRTDLKEPGQRRLRELVTDLETILLQIANLDSKNDLEAVEFVKQGVENRGIFLKINLSEIGGDLSRVGRQSAPKEAPSQKIKT